LGSLYASSAKRCWTIESVQLFHAPQLEREVVSRPSTASAKSLLRRTPELQLYLFRLSRAQVLSLSQVSSCKTKASICGQSRTSEYSLSSFACVRSIGMKLPIKKIGFRQSEESYSVFAMNTQIYSIAANT
jgi:hypothetical protein